MPCRLQEFMNLGTAACVESKMPATGRVLILWIMLSEKFVLEGVRSQ